MKEKIGKSYFTKYKSKDALDVPMYVIESLEAEKPGPTIVYVHGGPWSEVYDSWSPLILSLVAMGYHVLAPNFRGSTGYGEEFKNLDIGDPGGGELEDVASAAEFSPWGRSPSFGTPEWREMYSLSDTLFKNFIQALFGGLKEELLEERSPIKYVENVRAPLCIIHPQNDSRTPLKPVLKYIEKLLSVGVPFEVHVTPDVGHAIKSVEDLAKLILPAVLFLERYLREKG